MQECLYCHKDLDAKDKVCPHCGKAYPRGRAIYTFPSVIIAFLVCCVISFFYLRRYAGTPDWLSAVLAVPIVLLLFTGLNKLGQFCG
jgi:uncharacterized protein (DUF983 family)